mgnify:CR=1 FL=1
MRSFSSSKILRIISGTAMVANRRVIGEVKKSAKPYPMMRSDV